MTVGVMTVNKQRRVLTEGDYYILLLVVLASVGIGLAADVILVVLLDVFFVQYALVLAMCGVVLLCIQVGAGSVVASLYRLSSTKVYVRRVAWGMGLYWFSLSIWIGLSAGIAVPLANAPAWLNEHGAGLLFLLMLAFGLLPAMGIRLWKWWHGGGVLDSDI